jgi:LmbE family N-acetylglucosaminyl deacetylase
MRQVLRRVRKVGAAGVQALSRRILRAMLALRRQDMSEEELRRSALVFAPHQDDEVLGCGGVILRKRRLDAEVAVAFLTDGSGSHPDLMPAPEMRRLRQEEARAASDRLGVAKDRVLFLDFKDGELEKHLDAATVRAREVLRTFRPEQVFVPHHQDGPPDHLATTKAVLAALRVESIRATVYEYPVWMWCHWPWIGLPGGLRERLVNLRQSFRINRAFLKCRCSVPIGEVLPLKRAALHEHRSQVERLIPDPRWSVLGEVFEGQFLACFFQNREIFYRHDLEA